MAHGLSCSSSMWDLPRPGLEPVFSAMAGGFLTTAPPGKPHDKFFMYVISFNPPSETEQDPVGLLGTEAFRTFADLGRERMQRQGRSSQETKCRGLPQWSSGKESCRGRRFDFWLGN